MIRNFLSRVKPIVLHNLGDRGFFVHVDVDVVPTQAVQADDLTWLLSSLELLSNVLLLWI